MVVTVAPQIYVGHQGVEQRRPSVKMMKYTNRSLIRSSSTKEATHPTTRIAYIAIISGVMSPKKIEGAEHGTWGIISK